jgi:hypothetical protein
MFVVKGKSEAAARKICLEALMKSLDKSFRYSIIFDLDDNRDQMDRLTLSNSSKKLCMEDRLEYRHAEPYHENLLWLPDAVAWSFSRGGSWRKEVSKFEVRMVRLS